MAPVNVYVPPLAEQLERAMVASQKPLVAVSAMWLRSYMQHNWPQAHISDWSWQKNSRGATAAATASGEFQRVSTTTIRFCDQASYSACAAKYPNWKTEQSEAPKRTKSEKGKGKGKSKGAAIEVEDATAENAVWSGNPPAMEDLIMHALDAYGWVPIGTAAINTYLRTYYGIKTTGLPYRRGLHEAENKLVAAAFVEKKTRQITMALQQGVEAWHAMYDSDEENDPLKFEATKRKATGGGKVVRDEEEEEEEARGDLGGEDEEEESEEEYGLSADC